MPDRLPPRSLHDARIGERVRVLSVLFDTLRARCAEVGIHPGSEIRVVRRTAEHIHLALASGSAAILRRVESEFIEVQPVLRLPRPLDEERSTGPVAA